MPQYGWVELSKPQTPEAGTKGAVEVVVVVVVLVLGTYIVNVFVKVLVLLKYLKSSLHNLEDVFERKFTKQFLSEAEYSIPTQVSEFTQRALHCAKLFILRRKDRSWSKQPASSTNSSYLNRFAVSRLT